MALSEIERMNIVEEETLRAEIRKKMQAPGSCSKAAGHGCKRCRYSLWIILVLLGLGALHGMGRFHGWCGYDRGMAQPGATPGHWAWEPEAGSPLPPKK